MKNRNIFTRIPIASMSLALLFAVFAVGCSDDKNTNPAPDTLAPTVMSTNPINGSTGVALINATFSESMTASSLSNASFTVKGPGGSSVPGAVAYDANTMRVSFVPTNDLALGTAYTATIMTAAEDQAGNPLITNYVWNFTTSDAAIDQLGVVLASSGDYAVLAGSTIASTGTTVVTGDMGISPSSSVTGFPPGIVVGTKNIANASAVQAKLDLTEAYNSAAGRSTGAVMVAGNLGGMTLPAGLYKSAAGLAISSGDLTLDAKGNVNAVWIFQTTTTLVTTSDRKVILSGGAKAANIYWQVGTSATLGTNSIFKGIIFADQSITISTGASLEGRALARIGAVTLDASSVAKPTQ